MALIVHTTVGSAGAKQSGAHTTQAAAAGDQFRPGDKTWLRVINNDASNKQVRVVVAKDDTRSGLGLTMNDVVLTPGQEKMLGPFPARIFAGADGLATIAYDQGVTSVQVGAIEG